ncbi:hypothetical protein [Streptomyces pimonensis]|uniref:hypothetical protein n=1 Tax=Streptomyces pimonensis TaxID=2860288 RepID=UPI003F9FBE0C
MGATTRLQWSPHGDLTRRVAADGTTESWRYDGEGNCVEHTDPVGGVTRSEYTRFDLLAARTDPDGGRFEFVHDTCLRLIKVTDTQGQEWTYAYDAGPSPAGTTTICCPQC